MKKQERFAIEYVKTGYASEAYRIAYDAAGMKDATINRNAFELLQNSKITTRVNELRKTSAPDADKMKPNVINVKASELLSNGKITVRVRRKRFPKLSGHQLSDIFGQFNISLRSRRRAKPR